MWLPSSFFNRTFQFESTSKFGRQRKHNLDPENVPDGKNQKRKRHRNRKSEFIGSLILKVKTGRKWRMATRNALKEGIQ